MFSNSDFIFDDFASKIEKLRFLYVLDAYLNFRMNRTLKKRQ